MLDRLAAAHEIAAEVAQIASPEARSAYIASACGDDAELADMVRSLLAPLRLDKAAGHLDETALAPPAAVRSSVASDPTQRAEASEAYDEPTGVMPTHRSQDKHSQASENLQRSRDPHTVEDAETTADTNHVEDPAATVLSGPGTPPSRHKKLPPKIPQYEILEEIGLGGMGVVYKARHRQLKRQVALKMVRDSRIDDDSLARFHTEAEAVAKIQHPNVVQIFEVGEYDGQPYLALEFVDGDTLAGYARQRKPGSREAAEIVMVLARAMDCAHELGVVHRDLKPSNILIRTAVAPSSRAGELSARGLEKTSPAVSTGIVPKITDFGLAKQLDQDGDLTQAGTVLGTPNYMSPEQAEGMPATSAADIYALGATLYFLLTLRPPFRGKTFVDTLNCVRSQEPTPPRKISKSVPADLESISLKCLQKKQEDRYATAADLADDLKRYLQGDPVQAASLGWWYRANKFYERRKAHVLGGLAIALACILGLLAGWQLYRHSGENAEHARRVTQLQQLESLQTEFAGLLTTPYHKRHENIEAWLHRTAEITEQLPEFEASLEHVREYGHPTPDGEWEFAETKWSQRHGNLSALVEQCGRLVESGGALDRARSWLVLTPSPNLIAEAWNEALPRIERDHQLRIEPVDSFFPLGPNPAGLWEFAELETGHLPTQNDAGHCTLQPTTGLVFVLLNGGEFQLGSPPDEEFREEDEHFYTVRLSPLLVSKYEVTQAIWQRRMKFNNSFTQGPLHPIDSILWGEAGDFCSQLGLQLPSEAQAEYAMRGGTQSPFSFDGAPQDNAWFEENAYESTNPVGGKLPNAFGLFDVHGNVSEWCLDVYDRDFVPEDGALDPVNTTSAVHAWQDGIERRSLRGGSFHVKLAYLRSADRYGEKHNLRWKGFGLRPVRPVQLATTQN